MAFLRASSNDDSNQNLDQSSSEPREKSPHIEEVCVSEEATSLEESPVLPEDNKNTDVLLLGSENLWDNIDCVTTIFEYLNPSDLLKISTVNRTWNELAYTKRLWRTVRMRNLQITDWSQLSTTLLKVGTKHLSLRKMRKPGNPLQMRNMWQECTTAINQISTLVRLDLGSCTSYALELLLQTSNHLCVVTAHVVKSRYEAEVNIINIENWLNLTEFNLRASRIVNNMAALERLQNLKHLALLSIANINDALAVVGRIPQLESLELGHMVSVNRNTVIETLAKLTKLKRLRLEKGQMGCPTHQILRTIARLPNLTHLELIKFDIKDGFDRALMTCKNIKVLVVIPTYLNQVATTTHLMVYGVSELSNSLSHFVWGFTFGVLHRTYLFIRQFEEQLGEELPVSREAIKNCIPFIRSGIADENGMYKVDILTLPDLHTVLTELMPTTKIEVIKCSSSELWRHTISN